jgi:hypothetical protein
MTALVHQGGADAKVLSDFASQFAIPFLAGKQITVGNFLGAEGLKAARYGLSVHTGLADEIRDTLRRAALLTDIVPADFDEEIGTLLYAIHELYASCHPQSEAFYSRSHTYCILATEQVHTLSRTYDPGKLLARHIVVERAFRTCRLDTEVEWWSGDASYYGEAPPERLLRFPSLRRVSKRENLREMWNIADGEDESCAFRLALMSALLNFSPLTRLMLLGQDVQKTLGFSLMLPLKSSGKRMSPLFALDDRRIARMVVDQALEKGADRAGVMVSLALLEAIRQGHSPLAQRRASELCIHLFMMMCLIEDENPGAPESEPLRRLLAGHVGGEHEAQHVYWAVVSGAIELEGAYIELPPIKYLSESAKKIWTLALQHMQHPQVTFVKDALTRELKRRLPGLASDRRSRTAKGSNLRSRNTRTGTP